MTESTGPDLRETSRTETTVRHLDADGQVISETTTTVVIRKDGQTELPTGMYL